jgi:branched-chain amino acid transport system permease protein
MRLATIITVLATLQDNPARSRRWALGLLLLLASLIFPFVMPSYYLSLAIEVLIFAILAMSLDLLLGYTGLPSFGHAAFFGLGAYLVAYLSSRSELALGWTDNLLISAPVVTAGAAVAAVIMGWLALRTSGLYFLMITLALAQMLYSLAIHWSQVTGGSDGLSGIPRPTIGLGPLGYSFDSRESFYFMVLAIFLVSWWLLRRLVNSPFGLTLQGIRENEPRMQALGYNTFRFKLAAFVLAGSLAGLAGMLLALFFRYATPDHLYWTMSGQVLVMLIIGGVGTITGPVLGAGLVRLLPNLVSSYTDRWQLLLGLVFMGVVLLAPRGIFGLWRELTTKRRR